MIKENQEIISGEVLELQLSDDVSLHLIGCSAGHFHMGSGEDEMYSDHREKPKHKVRLASSFWIGQMPITYEQWNLIMPSKHRISTLESKYPIDRVSWEQANQFCKALNMRFSGGCLNLLKSIMNFSEKDNESYRFDLPTEVQWEYACRANTERTWFFTNEEQLDDYAWYSENSENHVHPVGLKKPNPWNIYDMYGNVSEWCRNSFYFYPNSIHKIDNMEINTQFKVTRGGSYNDNSDICRSSARATEHISNYYNDAIGFRIVLEIDNDSGMCQAF